MGEAKRRKLATIDSACVYHFTDTARLPWILEAGELRLQGMTQSDFPDIPGHLWATSNPQVDRTSACFGACKSFYCGYTRQVRFVLNPNDFDPWSIACERLPSAYVADLERKAGGMGETSAHWHCRAAPLPISSALAIETRARASRWQALKRVCVIKEKTDLAVRGILIDGLVYLSKRLRASDGQIGYITPPPMAADELNQHEMIDLESLGPLPVAAA
jgi:hypothetical protein